MISPQDRIILERFKALLSKRVSVRDMRAFGSRARGDAGAESDL
jgi:predicted nucleotidyltransferase